MYDNENIHNGIAWSLVLSIAAIIMGGARQ